MTTPIKDIAKTEENSSSSSVLPRVGDIVTRAGDPRPWRVVGAYPELGFARLECAGEAWVKSATERLENLAHVPDSDSENLHVV
jgi:hypothetical protein